MTDGFGSDLSGRAVSPAAMPKPSAAALVMSVRRAPSTSAGSLELAGFAVMVVLMILMRFGY
jgi:hypothetical protein